MKHRIFFFTALLGLSLIGCGKNKDDRNKDADKVISTEAPTADNSSAGAVAFNQVDEATDAIQDDSNVAGIVLAASGDRDITRSKSCTAGTDGTATVVITFSGSGSKTIAKAKMSATVTMSATGTETRLWTPPAGETLECNTAQNAAKINWNREALVTGLKTAIAVDKARNITKSITTSKRSFTATDNATIKGTRTVTWASVTSSTALVRTKTIESNVVRTKTSTDKEGKTTTLSSTISTKPDAPLSVTVDRSITDKTLTSKSINAGTLVSIETDGTRTESTFTSVVYDMTAANENKCQPVSGSISGKIFAGDATTPSKIFTIKFGDATVDSGVSVSYDEGTAEDYPDYNAKGCDLETET